MGTLKASPKQRPDIVFDLKMDVEDKPFEINFAQLPPSRSSIGAHQYIDNEIDFYMSRRWPKCLVLKGIVTFPEEALANKLAQDILLFVQKLCWNTNGEGFEKTFGPDQCAAVCGYRREYFEKQLFDICGNRRPNSCERYVSTEIGEPVGPGVASLPEVDFFDGINELIWTPILPFSDRRTLDEDLPNIRTAVGALRKHYNSYSELRDAHRHITNGDVKAAIRSAAPAVDAILRFYQKLWRVPPPAKKLPFDEKIEQMLRSAGRPSYRDVAPLHLENLLYLYRCRSSMHEGDNYYKDRQDNRVDVRTIEQTQTFIDAVEDFVIWIDSLA
jgi:hypothetical protein